MHANCFVHHNFLVSLRLTTKVQNENPKTPRFVLSLFPFLVAYFDFCYPYTFILCISLRFVTLCNFVINELCVLWTRVNNLTPEADEVRFSVCCPNCFFSIFQVSSFSKAVLSIRHKPLEDALEHDATSLLITFVWFTSRENGSLSLHICFKDNPNSLGLEPTQMLVWERIRVSGLVTFQITFSPLYHTNPGNNLRHKLSFKCSKLLHAKGEHKCRY